MRVKEYLIINHLKIKTNLNLIYKYVKKILFCTVTKHN